jgi:hypothetical protein
VPIIAPVHSDVEIGTAIIGLRREPGDGLVVMPDNFTHRAPIILAAARNATYVDRILRGEKPGDLTVQFSTKFEAP